jgi:electron transport complex protein RnfB
MDVLIAISILLILGLVFGALLGYSAIRFKVEGNPLVAQLDALLPQTQCGQCDYPGCKPYAEALAAGEAVNKCVPGGEATMLEIASLLGVDPEPLDEDKAAEPEATIVWIREEDCIGCTKCIQVCPVDAILGAAKYMHTVIEVNCTGCDLCIPVCPTDCIEIHPAKTGIAAWHPQNPVDIQAQHGQRIPIEMVQ